ncbi:hypothetical protein RSAG8_06880, partial [Rhizoctonia solani AG-8 WAC10335]
MDSIGTRRIWDEVIIFSGKMVFAFEQFPMSI